MTIASRFKLERQDCSSRCVLASQGCLVSNDMQKNLSLFYCWGTWCGGSQRYKKISKDWSGPQGLRAGRGAQEGSGAHGLPRCCPAHPPRTPGSGVSQYPHTSTYAVFILGSKCFPPKV
eukprot:5391929-Amphidinium_carterae.1